MNEFYAEGTLATSRRLYETIGPWAKHRSDVTLIGGWAVYELVNPARAMQSRDIDLIFHNQAALLAFDQRLPEWGLAWRTHGRNRFNDCHLADDPEKNIVVDVFLDHPFEQRLFKGRKAAMGLAIKSADGNGYLPRLDYMIHDKVTTVPLRQRDRVSKQAKDLLDIHALVFHNRAGTPPMELLQSASLAGRRRAAEALPGAMDLRPQNRVELEEVSRWLHFEPV